MNKSILVTCIVLLILAAGYLFNDIKRAEIPEEVIHYHAGFVVFEGNKKVDFSDSKYMHILPCKVEGDDAEIQPSANSQLEKAHLHDNVGEIVHIHVNSKSTTWDDLFVNINFPIDYPKAQGYINGQKVDAFYNKNINAYDSLVVLIGENDTALVNEGVTKENIISKESQTGGCSE